MAVSFYSGKPGGGKSYFAVRQICEELKLSRRAVVTNLALDLKELAAWCQENCPDGASAVHRVRLLDDNQTSRFWLHYAPGCDTEARLQLKKGDKTEDVPDLQTRVDKLGVEYHGTLYVIDEVHIHYGARAWAQTGPDLLYYLSQHRKCWDDVILISQHVAQVDKALRRLVQDYTMLTNLGKTSIAGFTIPNWIRRATYNDETFRDPFETGWVKLDIRQYGKLYNTNAGVGIVGRLEVREKSGSGRHPLWGLVWVVLFLIAAWYLPQLFTKTMGAFARRTMSGISEAGQGAIPPLMKGSTNSVQTTNAIVPLSTVKTNLPTATDAKPATNAPALVIDRRIIIGEKKTYWLSDGRKISSEDPDVMTAGEDFLVLRPGKVVRLK